MMLACGDVARVELAADQGLDRGGESAMKAMTGDGPERAEKAYITVAEAASRLGVGENCVYDACRSHRLAHYRLAFEGGAIRIRPVDLCRYARSCRVESALPRGNGARRKFINFTL
jgi:excisionase family DNA binding protein